MFGNKWNDIAAYLPMRCNNDIKNYFNLYLKEKTNVYSENCYLRSGYDLSQLLQSEPDEVVQRRQRLDAEKVRFGRLSMLRCSSQGCCPSSRRSGSSSGCDHLKSLGRSFLGEVSRGSRRLSEPKRQLYGRTSCTVRHSMMFAA